MLVGGRPVTQPQGTTGSVGQLRSRVKPWVGEALERSAELGFLGGMSVGDQIDHALGFVHAAESRMKEPPASIVDLGSGGGVPGLVLAFLLARKPDTSHREQ